MRGGDREGGGDEPARPRTTAFRVTGAVLSAIASPFVRFDLPPAHQHPTTRPVIWAPNHRSMFDIFVGVIGLQRMGDEASFFVNARYFDVPIGGRLLRALGALPVDVEGSGVKAIGAGVESLSGGRDLVIMAEGRLVSPDERDGGIGSLATGVGVLAKRAGVPVIPVAMIGTDQVLPIGRRFPRLRFGRRRLVLVRCGEPVMIGGRAREGIAALRDALSDLVLAAEAEHAQQDRYRRPPAATARLRLLSRERGVSRGRVSGWPSGRSRPRSRF